MRRLIQTIALVIGVLFIMSGIAQNNLAIAATASPLAAAGYAALPQPQSVELAAGDVVIDPSWHVGLGAGVAEGDFAVEALVEGLRSRENLALAAAGQGPAISLSIQAGAVRIGEALDQDKAALAEQAYRLEISPKGISITANAPAGLFYGVETLVQLAKWKNGAICVPAAVITDWPDLRLRENYWDDAHHLDRIDVLKHAIRQAAFYKINGFVIKLEGHFQYKHAPAAVEPQALSPRQLQELTDYGLRYHVQVIPYLDAPAHIAFILKHPEYASLRAFPDSNYELNIANPASCELLTGMYQDLLDANKGVNYFYLSTDEPYYVGMSDDPKFSEAAMQKKLGSPGKMLAAFLEKTAGYLHDHGRTVVFWGERPTKPSDIPSFPSYLVNGETGPAAFNTACKEHGIQQIFYTSTQGEEPLFPDYYSLPAADRLHPAKAGEGRVASNLDAIISDPARQQSDIRGCMVAAWADSGLHPETFWLGYATIASAGWNPSAFSHPPAAGAAAASADFFKLFYGPSARNMHRVYQLMSDQAQFWADSWEKGPSTARKGIWGNSSSIYNPRHSALDQFLPLPPAPLPDDLSYHSTWLKDNAHRLELTQAAMKGNDELLARLDENLRLVESNQYNLDVYLSIARLCRQNLNFIDGISRIDALLTSASKSAAGDPAAAVAFVDQAIDLAHALRDDRNTVLKDATATWYKSWMPRVAEANGRTFLHDLDDVKDHLPDRTIGMDYLVYRELLLPVGQWMGKVQESRNAFALAHNLPERKDSLDWNQTPTEISQSSASRPAGSQP